MKDRKGSEEKAEVMKQFGANAEKYVASESHAKGEDLPQLVQWIKPKADWVALDIATGGGHVAKSLAPHVREVFATDLTKAMLANTANHLKKSFSNITYVVADAEDLPFLEGTFDLVTCRIAPHHFPNPDQYIAEAARVLKPGGLFLMIDNVAPEEEELAEYLNTFEKLRDVSHVASLSVSKWKEYLAEEGMVEVQSQLKKKTYKFPAWVERTAQDSDQIMRVHHYITSASKEIKEYFQVDAAAGEVKSVTIDEWMTLHQKGGMENE